MNNKFLSKKLLIILILISIIILTIVLITYFTSPKFTHICEFSVKAESTTTCTYLGKTTYKCKYYCSKNIFCKKTKIIADKDYASCNFTNDTPVYEKISQSKYISTCSVCKSQKEYIVNHSNRKYKDNIGNWYIIGDSKADLNNNPKGWFQCLLFTREEIKFAKDINYYIVLNLYDKNENLYSSYFMQCHILGTKMYTHTFKIANNYNEKKYYDHRWELRASKPNRGTELKYYNYK